ncbi:MAG: tetratricopeptide repeat protein, partial [Flavobacteriales bacterium]
MRFKIFTTTLFLVWVVAQTGVFAQSPQQYERFGDDAAYDRNAWDEAFGYYQQAYALDSSSFLLRKKLADAAREVKYYPLAYQLYTQNYSIDEGKSDPNALFYMAWLEKTMGRYEDAQRNFKKFTKKSKGADKALMEIATHEVKASQWAMNNSEKNDSPDSLLLLMMGPDCSGIKWKKSKLPSNIIGSASEMAPLQMQTTFYYTDFADNKWRVHMADVLYDSVRTQANPP